MAGRPNAYEASVDGLPSASPLILVAPIMRRHWQISVDMWTLSVLLQLASSRLMVSLKSHLPQRTLIGLLGMDHAPAPNVIANSAQSLATGPPELGVAALPLHLQASLVRVIYFCGKCGNTNFVVSAPQGMLAAVRCSAHRIPPISQHHKRKEKKDRGTDAHDRETPATSPNRAQRTDKLVVAHPQNITQRRPRHLAVQSNRTWAHPIGRPICTENAMGAKNTRNPCSTVTTHDLIPPRQEL